jgi:hypothetical protein
LVNTTLPLSAACRARGIHIICAELHGLCGRIAVDFGTDFVVLERDAEPVREVVLENIDMEKGVVTCLRGTRQHGFATDDIVQLREVVEANQIAAKKTLNGG